uniref:F-box domain-containing protein n=1 Tax=Arundo donax TaxID=35708 RepID=A0A0A9BTQ8_ARUDO
MCSSASPRRRRKKTTSPPASAAAEARDWAALPGDILFAVFLKLGPREVMLGAEFACTAWRRVALEEPSLWRRIGWDRIIDSRVGVGVGEEMAMARVALARTAGQCEAFKGFCEGDDLTNLVERAPSLKSLFLRDYSDDQSSELLIVALRKLPLLQDLQIYISDYIYPIDNQLQSVCQACPHLKKLALTYAASYDAESIDRGIPLMRELCSLELYQFDLSVNGLNTILDNCPLLEYLHVGGYFNQRKMDTELRVKCARVKKLTLPTRQKPAYKSAECYMPYNMTYNAGYSDDSSEDGFSEEDSQHE